MEVEKMLVKDRKCGSCSVCCVSLAIDEPELKKKHAVPCTYLRPQGGCSIYADRPSLCKTWHCGWRMMPFMGPALRPDRSNLLVRLTGECWIFGDADDQRESALMNNDTLNAMSALVSRNMKVSVSVPTKPGYCDAEHVINDDIMEAVKERSLSKVKEIIWTVICRCKVSATNPRKQ